MYWWEDLWLNEAFATFMGIVVHEKMDNKFKINNHFYDLVKNAFENDSRCYTHAISTQLSDVDKVSEIFDDISYRKGATIIRNFYT